jgi:hypothetical protein
MVTNVLDSAPGSALAEALSALTSAEGTMGHRYAQGADLHSSRHATRNLADVCHYLCILHGRHPGIIDHAANRITHIEARVWLEKAIEGFALERSVLTRLVVAAGPLPSTPGQAECDSTVNGQRHALEMLAQSDRNGCAFGAATALVMEWESLRQILELAAKRLSIEIPASRLPSRVETLDVINVVAETTAIERAMTFGAHQLLGQHHGLWDLLEARNLARGEY